MTTLATVITRNYLHQAMVLAESLSENSPGSTLFVCVVDEDPSLRIASHCSKLPIRFVALNDILILPSLMTTERFLFQYSALELTCALKPFLVRYLLKQFTSVFWIDSDFFIYAPLDQLADRFEDNDALLAPHLRSPWPQTDYQPSDRSLKKNGTIQAGIFGFRATPHSNVMLDWLCTKLTTQCIHDLSNRFHVDQSWLEFLPYLFEKVKVDRSIDMNIGNWNLYECNFSHNRAGHIGVNDRRLLSFHYSGFPLDGPVRLSSYPHTIRPDQQDILSRMATDYRSRLLSAAQSTGCRDWAYGFDRLNDGTPIKKEWREAVRIQHPSLSSVKNPFDASGNPSLKNQFRKVEPAMRLSRMDWLLEDIATLRQKPLSQAWRMFWNYLPIVMKR